MNKFLVMDIEADGLFNDYYKKNATRIWCAAFIDDKGEITIFVNDEDIHDCTLPGCKPLSKLKPWITEKAKSYDAIICHNVIHYDLRMLKKFLGVDYSIKPDTICGEKIEIVDTLLDSKWLNPKRMLPWGCPGSIKPADGGKSKIIGPHGLEAWGYRTSKKKPSIEDWEGLHIDQYVNRCIEDIKINYDTFVLLNTEISIYFKGVDDISQWKNNRDKAALPIYIEHKFKQDITEQEENGVPFHVELAKSYLPRLDKELDELRTHIESHLPNIPIPPSRLKDWKFPAKPFNNDGTPSKNFDKWVEKFNGRYWKGEDGKWYCEIEVDGKKKEYKAPFPEYIKTTEQMTVRSEHLAQYIIDTYGWKPMYWNYQIDPKTKKKVRDKDKKLIPTSPRFKEAQSGRLCPNLEALEVPFVKDVLRYRTLEHRRFTIESMSNDVKGYLNHPRLAIDSRLPAGMDTIGAACFTADTLILSEKGQIYWEEIEVGDKVATHENRLMPVTDKFVNGYKKVFEVELENGIKTRVTDNHPFLTERGWKECKDLSENDRVLAYPSKEEWKQWKDEPIMVSNWGRVRSLASGKMYKTRNLTNGRRGVDIGLRGNKFRSFRVARLVLEAFNGFCPDYRCLHKNDLAFDDHIDNLYWGTQQDNAKDREKFGTSRPGSNSYKLTDRDILAILRSDKTSKETARKYSVSDSYIREIRRREKRLLKEYQEKVFSTKWIKVKSITPKGEAWTYGITVEGDHSHLTDGIFTHNTSRVTHKGVCNVPKADEDVLFGKELRSLFWNGGDPEWYVLGYDASGLEARLEGSEAAEFDGGEYAEILINEDIHCYSGDHEVLTPNGWKRLDCLNSSETVAQFNKSDNAISFEKIKEYVAKQTPTAMLKFSRSGLVVTPNHRMLEIDIRNKNYIERLASEKAVVKNGSLRQLTCGAYHGGKDENKWLLKLLVAVQADGSISESQSITFEFKKDRKVSRLNQILSKLDNEELIYNSRKNKRGNTSFYLCKKWFNKLLSKYITRDKVLINETILSLNKDSLGTIINELAYWDGTTNKQGTIILDTTCVATRDLVSAVAPLCDRKCTAHSYHKKTVYGDCDVFRVSIFKPGNRYLGSLEKVTPVLEDGYYCVSVPSGYIVVRTPSGKVVISGNTINADFFEIKRGPAKNIKYGLGYGAGAPKIAQMLNITIEQARMVLEEWWIKYWSVKKVIDKIQKQWKRNGEKYITGVDGRPIQMNSPHLALNYRLQNAGTVAMKLHACYMYDKVMKYKTAGKAIKVIDYHDEAMWLVHKDIIKFKKCKNEDEAKWYQKEKFCSKPMEIKGEWWVGYSPIGELGIKSITEAGARLGIRVPLTGEYQIGRSWADVH